MDLPFITLYFAGQEHEPERTAIIIFNRTVRKSSVHCFGQSNDFAETKCFYTVIECTSLQSLRICLTQTAGGAVPVPPCREEVWMLVLLLSINFVIVQIYIYIYTYKSQQVYSTSIHLLFRTACAKQNQTRKRTCF